MVLGLAPFLRQFRKQEMCQDASQFQNRTILNANPANGMVGSNRVGKASCRCLARMRFINFVPFPPSFPISPGYGFGRAESVASCTFPALRFKYRIPGFEWDISQYSPKPDPRAKLFGNLEVALSNPSEPGERRRGFVREKSRQGFRVIFPIIVVYGERRVPKVKDIGFKFFGSRGEVGI